MALKLLVLGHSDSDGSRLPDAGSAWPALVARELAQVSNLEVEVTHKPLFPGRSATRFVDSELAAHRPDIVVVAGSSYSAAFEFVSKRLEELLGERFAKLVEPLERATGSWASSHAGAARATTVPRRAMRRLLGTRPSSNLDAVLQAYRQVFQRLAREENIQTIVLGGCGYSRYHELLNPGMLAISDVFAVELRAAAASHHFDWVSHEELLGGRGTKEPYFFPDGVHTNEQAQRLVADAIVPAIAGRWGGR